MKKRLLIIGISALVVAIVVIVLLTRTRYIIRVSLVDDQSPDRILTVYDNKNQKVEVKKIKYLDGTLLCNGYNMTVHFGDIENETELKVVLKDRSEVKAKIVKEEVK